MSSIIAAPPELFMPYMELRWVDVKNVELLCPRQQSRGDIITQLPCRNPNCVSDSKMQAETSKSAVSNTSVMRSHAVQRVLQGLLIGVPSRLRDVDVALDLRFLSLPCYDVLMPMAAIVSPSAS